MKFIVILLIGVTLAFIAVKIAEAINISRRIRALEQKKDEIP